LGFVNPLVAIIIAIGFLIVLLYKRVNLGIALNATALFLALLAVDLGMIIPVIITTTLDLLTISVCAATFGIMLLSELYKETGMIRRLSESVSRLINNPKIVLCILPAIIGLLPVGGGALVSAPLVDSEADKLKMTPSKKAYVNLWFRHTIFPVYPLGPVIIATAVLTKLSIPSIIVRQIPVVLVMVIVGYIIGFWKVSQVKKDAPDIRANRKSDLNNFFISFFPILATILIDVALNLAGFNQLLSGFDVVIAILIGIAIFVAITKLNSMVFVKPLKSWGIWGITAAAYGAFLLRNVMDAAGISNVFSSYVANGSIDVVLFLAVGPALLGLLTGSAQGGVAVSVSILSTIFPLPFAAKVAALVYISAYLGYTIAPTHLCLTFTADYFKCSLGKMYKYIIPSFLITFSIALLVYFLL
jgi:integral membrane protein (TIGR00529 family)